MGPPHIVSLLASSVLVAVDMFLFPACTSTSVPLWTSDSAALTWSPASPCLPSLPLQCLSFLHSPASRGLSTLAAFLPHLQFPLQPTAS
ncbi:rCG27753, isoform CRA_b [Rattus norvegicus]|uniref:RCG27753, isoform CRA_b n=1 Tax=Rattus norvegicus TaxID=10116 RepID=A6KBJ9_RAT|nr:rCG27753, isoform CRA_b [Rattus norvegicus]